MGISINELIYDPSAPDDSSNVGAHLRAGTDGTPIGAVGDALKVDIGSVSDLDIRDLEFATDKVDASGSEVSLDAATLAVLENITVSATDLDIRDLAFATDSVDVSGSTVELGATSLAALENITVEVSNEVEITNDVGNPIPVSATDLDIRDLAFATDKVDASGSSVKETGYNTVKSTAQTITSTASQLAATALTGRNRMLIQNLGNQDIYIGAADVTSANGVLIPKGASGEWPFSASAIVYAATNGGTSAIRLLELAF